MCRVGGCGCQLSCWRIIALPAGSPAVLHALHACAVAAPHPPPLLCPCCLSSTTIPSSPPPTHPNTHNHDPPTPPPHVPATPNPQSTYPPAPLPFSPPPPSPNPPPATSVSVTGPPPPPIITSLAFSGVSAVLTLVPGNGADQGGAYTITASPVGGRAGGIKLTADTTASQVCARWWVWWWWGWEGDSF